MHFFHIVADGTWQIALLKITQYQCQQIISELIKPHIKSSMLKTMESNLELWEEGIYMTKC